MNNCQEKNCMEIAYHEFIIGCERKWLCKNHIKGVLDKSANNSGQTKVMGQMDKRNDGAEKSGEGVSDAWGN